MKIKATFVRTTWSAVGKETQITEWRLPGGHHDLYRVLGPKYTGQFLQNLMQYKRAEIIHNTSAVVWELFEKDIEHKEYS